MVGGKVEERGEKMRGGKVEEKREVGRWKRRGRWEGKKW